jgi:dihydrofolate synthase/folylpolyglutamate synthase
MVIGFVSDKDTDSILPMFPRKVKYYFTRASVPRAMDENMLRSKAAEFGLTGNSYHTVNEALTEARARAAKTDVIFVGGSTFVVAEAL